jgi:SHS family sialic acid transporter-like MFS transporter
MIYLYIDQSIPPVVQIAGTVLGLALVTAGYLLPVILYLRRAEDRTLTSSATEPSAAPAPGGARRRGTLGLMLLAACLSGVALLGTWGTVQQTPSWSGSLANRPDDYSAQTQIWSALGAILGTIVAAFVADLLGRRLTYTFLCLGSFLIIPAMFLTTETFDARFLVLVFLAGAITASFYGWLPLYLPELFPTRVRATGQGFGFNFGRIIAAIGVLQLGNLKRWLAPYGWSDGNIFSLLAAIYLLGMLIIWLAPETKGKPLPE